MDVGFGDDCKDTSAVAGPGEVDQSDLPGVEDLAQGVRKVLRSEETEFRYECKHQPYPRMGAWRETLDRLLSANAAKPQRERLTLIRIFEELRGLGYDGSYSSGWRHAQSWRRIAAAPWPRPTFR